MGGVDLVELQNKVLTLEKSFAELAKWTQFHFNFTPQQNITITNGFENIENSPSSEIPTSPSVPVANVAASETLGESTGSRWNRGRRDLGEIRVVCKDEPMDENDDEGINNPNPQGTSTGGTQVEAPISVTVSARSGVGVEEEGSKDEGVIPPVKTEGDVICTCKLEDDSAEDGDLNSVSSENEKTAGNKNKRSAMKKSPTAKKSSSSTSGRKSPFVSLKRLSSAQILSIKKKMGVISKRGWKCPHCPRILSCKSHLRIHIRCHTGERPFHCPHCPEARTQAGHLRHHIRSIHPKENQKLFSCKLCGNKFQTRKIRMAHMKKHLTCYFCSRVFVGILHMRHHLATHTGEKPFSCPHCQYCTNQEGQLRDHIRRKHPAKY